MCNVSPLVQACTASKLFNEAVDPVEEIIELEEQIIAQSLVKKETM